MTLIQCKEIELDAAELLLRSTDCRTDEEDRRREEWLNEDPLHRAAFLRLSAAWKTTETLRAQGASIRSQRVENVAWRAGSSGHEGAEKPPRAPEARTGLASRRWVIRALVLLAIPGSAAIWLTFKVKGREPQSVEVGLTLSVIPGAAARSPSAQESLGPEEARRSSRPVEPHPSMKPQPMRTRAARSQAPNERPVQQDRPAEGNFVLDQDEAHAPIQLTFAATPLREAIEIFNARNAKKLVLTDLALSDLQIGGTFSADDPEGFARGLAQLLGVHVIKSGAVIRIDSGREPGELSTHIAVDE